MEGTFLNKGEKITAGIITAFVLALVLCRIGLVQTSFSGITRLSSAIEVELPKEQVAAALDAAGEKFIIDFKPFGAKADTADEVTKLLGPYRTHVMRVTAYCPCRRCCGGWSDGRTASGHRIRRGQVFCAADKAIPFNTVIAVPGYNHGQPIHVLDRGRVIRRNCLDVYFRSHHKAKAWGVRYLKCRIYKKRPDRKTASLVREFG